MSYFTDAARSVHPEWPQDGPGLRLAQLGALWALGSRFTLSAAPVQAVLPTGTGKTAVMTLLPFSVPTTRLLVVTPSRLVRDQVANEFRSLAVLKATGTCSAELAPPVVLRVDHRMRDWAACEGADVVVGTPSVLSDVYPDVAAVPPGLFDLVAIDEAHHAAAPTWEALLDQFVGVRAALFTATPFRRDRRGLPGDIAYAYPLSQAIEDGVYQPIDFLPVDLVPGQDRDVLLAEMAIARLNEPIHSSAHSAIIVRTDNIDDAERLVDLYHDRGVEIGLIHSRQSLRTARGVVARLNAGDLRGVASVGVLGEGFDLPRLKIAVYHRRHKSLPATLQFVGRIARVPPGSPVPPAELIAVREDVQDETRRLYASDSSWAALLPAIAEAAVDRERTRREYLQQLRPSEDVEFSVFALQPRLQAEVLVASEGTAINLRYDAPTLAGGVVLESFADDAGELLAIVTRHRWSPEWLQSDVLDTEEHRLHLVMHDALRSLLFVSTSSDAALAQLLFEIGSEGADRIPASAMNRFLHGLDVLSYSSIGMRSAVAPSPHQATYRMIASSAAERAVRQGEARAYGVGHLIGRHRDSDGHLHAIGVSIGKRKVWSPETGDLLAYKEWCFQVGALMQATGAVARRAPLLDLQMPDDLREFAAEPIIAVIDWHLLQGESRLEIPNADAVDLAEAEAQVEAIDAQHYRLWLEVDGARVWSGTVGVSGRVTTEGDDLRLWIGQDEWSAADALTEWPVCTYFADGSCATGSAYFPGAQDLGPAPAEVLRRLDWVGVDVHRESKPGRDALTNVQERMLRWIREELEPEIVIIDDSANELADIVVITRAVNGARLYLIHCKWSSEDRPGHRLDDVHDLLCQAVRSARWSGARDFFVRLLRRVERDGRTVIVGEDAAHQLDQLRRWAAEPPAARFTVVAAQPGLRIEDVTNHAAINALIVNCTDWTRSQNADLLVIGS